MESEVELSGNRRRPRYMRTSTSTGRRRSTDRIPFARKQLHRSSKLSINCFLSLHEFIVPFTFVYFYEKDKNQFLQHSPKAENNRRDTYQGIARRSIIREGRSRAMPAPQPRPYSFPALSARESIQAALAVLPSPPTYVKPQAPLQAASPSRESCVRALQR